MSTARLMVEVVFKVSRAVKNSFKPQTFQSLIRHNELCVNNHVFQTGYFLHI